MKNIKLKILLLFQSMLPLFIMVCFINFNIILKGINDKEYSLTFISTVVVDFILIILIMLGAFSFITVSGFISHGEETPRTLIECKKVNKVSLDFFMGYLVPIVLANYSNFGSVLSFLAIVFILGTLIYKTDLFYLNPILIVFGYNIYEIRFKNEKQYICIIRGNLKVNDVLLYKSITELVIFGRISR